MGYYFICLKYTSLCIGLASTVLCMVLVGLSALDYRETDLNRLSIGVMAAVGVPLSALGVYGALRHHCYYFLAFVFYVLFQSVVAIAIGVRDPTFWWYPSILWICWLVLGLFGEELRDCRRRERYEII